jgi:hypothetical protein
MFTLGGISLVVFILRFVVFTFEESPKFLLGKGKDEAALKVLHKVAKTNKRECNITMETFAALSRSPTSPPLSDNGAALETTSGTPMLELPGGVKLKIASLLQKARFEIVRIKMLFATPTLVRLTLLVWVIYAFDYWGFSVAGTRCLSRGLST